MFLAQISSLSGLERYFDLNNSLLKPVIEVEDYALTITGAALAETVTSKEKVVPPIVTSTS